MDAGLRETGASAVIYGGMEARGVTFEGVADPFEGMLCAAPNT